MNYREWSENYVQEAQNLKNVIDKERANLNKAKNFDEIKSINKRIQILKSMYYECKLTASFLSSKAKDLEELEGESVA